MTSKTVALVALVGSLATSACDSLGQAMTAHTDVLARAAGRELSVERAASLIASNPQIPAQPDIVNAVANIWVDYTLLAAAAAQDSTLRNIQLDALMEPVAEQEIVFKLRDKVLQVDTALTDDQLRELFEQSGTGLQIRARHILLRLPPDATPQQRDSVLALATRIRQQAASGADFAKLAGEHGQDGTRETGGDLGFFGRGQMVKPFEDAAFALQPGQVSDLVETPFGLHIIKLEERRTPRFEEFRDSFREQAKFQRIADAEEAYVKALTDSMQIAVQTGAYEIVREMAGGADKGLRGRAANRVLVKYKNGEFTAADFQKFVRRVPAQTRVQIPPRSDEELKQLLENLTRNNILVAEAKRQGLDVPQTRRDSARNDVYEQIAQMVQQVGLNNIQPQQGETKEQAIERRVLALVEATVKGEQELMQLGALSYQLRDQLGGQVFERAVPAVVAKLEVGRQGMPGAGQPMPQPGTPPAGTGR